MDTGKIRINIMSSCDENYARYVFVQLLSMADSLLDPNATTAYELHYYLFYSDIRSETLERLHRYCLTLGIVFHKVLITEVAPYAELASRGGLWTKEAYFSLECHRYLPPEVERILYIDAADVLIVGDIGEYYFSDFEGNTIIASNSFHRRYGELPFSQKDILRDEELRKKILLEGLFNSGSYMLNLEKMRRNGVSLNDYIAIKDMLAGMYSDNRGLYLGDQGILSAAFIGDIKYFGYPQPEYEPFNYCVWFFYYESEMRDAKPWHYPSYIPRILHFAGYNKPWDLSSERKEWLNPVQWSFCKLYELYAARIPHDIRNMERLLHPRHPSPAKTP